MTTAARTRRRRLADVALAPLTWLERARGRWRLALALLYLLILAVAAALTWRAFSLWDLPDVGEPFDVAAFTTCDVPDDQNAFALYQKAAAMLRPLRDPSGKEVSMQDLGISKRWATAGPLARAWHELNRGALETWRAGTERDRAWPKVGPDRPDLERWQEVEHLQLFTSMALAEASRLQDAGDVAGAWDWYRAALRGSRHATARGFGTAQATYLWEWTAIDVQQWAALPGVDRPLLRRALNDVLAADALVPSDEETIKEYYLALKKILGQSREDWLNRERAAELNPYRTLLHEPELRWFMRREPERTGRMARIAVANWLAHRAIDPDAGFDLRAGPLALWSLGPEAPAAARAISIDEAWFLFDSSLILKTMPVTPVHMLENVLNADRRKRADTIVFLASRLYALDRGKPPASARELVGPYLKRLPDGYSDPATNAPARGPGGTPRAASLPPAGS
ncbi:MAG TPA: hypothetical protein VG406_17395 [Isosphaeraceae bacterium]|jgi:hypothetical protein|nr:hypothetical protein [Isosphaeraceae bacterium]